MSDKSTNVHMMHTTPQTNSGTSKDESQELMALWPGVVRDLTEDVRHSDIPVVNKWLAKVLEHNVPDGKKNRALFLVNAYRQLVPQSQLTEENLRLARMLGWCKELLQSFLVIEDDIMDNSLTRRGRPCWYRQNDIGLSAINDGILLEHALFQLLRIHFKNKPYYIDLVDSFHDYIYKTALGQSLDLMSTTQGKKPNLNLFTMDRYNAITKYKTAYYSIAMPVTLAMNLAGIKDPEVHRQATAVLLEMGHFLQVQDDYLDCFGDPKAMRKIGTDIQEGKCTWLVVLALQRVNPSQRKILEECYGENDPEKVAKVKQLFHDLGLEKTYFAYDEENYNLTKTHIQQLSCGLPHELFFKMLNKVYRRNM